MSTSRLVYSSETGRICPDCSRAVQQCVCREVKRTPAGDGTVRIRRESKGRGGKTVTVITGLPGDDASLKQLAADLKKRCGTGGTLKDCVVEIQGDHAALLMAELQSKGFRVKRSGG